MGQLPSSQGVASWSQTCAELVVADYNHTCSSGFTDRNNVPWLAAGNTSCPPLASVADAQAQGIWGVNKPTCDRICGSDVIFQSFQFTNFASASANWLLPWLALSAQLPYEGEGLRNNAMSFFLGGSGHIRRRGMSAKSASIGTGSPCLVALSIVLTALNRVQIRKNFTYLIVEKARRIANSIPFFEERLEAACELLQEAQQCPMRLSNKDGWLSSLILLPNNTRFWVSVLAYTELVEVRVLRNRDRNRL
jgi:hypothetical protein